MNVIDVTEYFAQHYGDSIVKAERKGGNVPVLFDDGDHFDLFYRWLVGDDAALHRVLGSEMARWGKDEIDPGQPLFEQFRLFP